MLMLKLAAVTCAFYLGAVILMVAALIALTRGMGGVFIASPHPKLASTVFFGIIWLVSFLLSWRIVIVPVFQRLPK